MTLFRTQTGFTLLEILIAVAIFALVSAATFGMLQQTITASDVFDDKAAALVKLQRAKRLMQQDFSQVIDRPIRDQYGDELPAMMTEKQSWGVAVELSRTGRVNPLNKIRSDVLRVRYFFDGEQLVRRAWKHLDRAPEAEYFDQVVLDKVKGWQVLMLADQQWVNSWPDPAANTQVRLPNAVEVKITLDAQQEIRWLFTGSANRQVAIEYALQ